MVASWMAGASGWKSSVVVTSVIFKGALLGERLSSSPLRGKIEMGGTF
jgi:hypothetical protein